MEAIRSSTRCPTWGRPWLPVTARSLRTWCGAPPATADPLWSHRLALLKKTKEVVIVGRQTSQRGFRNRIDSHACLRSSREGIERIHLDKNSRISVLRVKPARGSRLPEVGRRRRTSRGRGTRRPVHCCSGDTSAVRGRPRTRRPALRAHPRSPGLPHRSRALRMSRPARAAHSDPPGAAHAQRPTRDERAHLAVRSPSSTGRAHYPFAAQASRLPKASSTRRSPMNRSSRLLAPTAALFRRTLRPAMEPIVRHFAGSSRSSRPRTDPVALATLNSPSGVTIDFFCETSYCGRREPHHPADHTGRRAVTTLAGLAERGSVDGRGSAAQLNEPRGIAVDGAGNVFVADSGNHTIRR